MPEHESTGQTPVGGAARRHPPMAPLEEVWGWPLGRRLTSVSTREGARAALGAEEATSVLHPAGLRWAAARGACMVGYLLAGLWFITGLTGSTLGGRSLDGQVGPFLLFGLVAVLNPLIPWAGLRAEPLRRYLPATRVARLRLTAAAFRGDVPVAPAARWPAGSEAFALLATTAMTEGIDGAWLLDRAALPDEVGREWLRVMSRLGWLSGGEAYLRGWLRQPWRITTAGRDRLRDERRTLQALAGS